MSHRLFAGLPAPGPIGLGEHLEMHGEAPLLTRAGAQELIAEVSAAGLRGRGGAGFPMGTKLAAVVEGRRPLVVVNGTEGEPMSAKDRALLELVPHLVLDGTILAAQAVGARDAVIAVPAVSLPGIRAALNERRQLRQRVTVRLAAAASGYVAGEETAVLAHLEGRRPLPRPTPPHPAERGLNGRPTLVQNVETIAHLALIARHGAAWFRERGSDDRPGTTLVTISGAVERPGVYEVSPGIELPHLLAIAGGTTEEIRALMVGGYFGAWVDGSGDGLYLDDRSLNSAGAAPGAGVLVALGAGACPVMENARLTAWMAAESAGQCGPCLHGLGSLAGVLERIAGGRAEASDMSRLHRWTGMVTGRGACAHPDGAARMISSAAEVFAAEFERHATRGPCIACRRPRVLATPDLRARAA